MKIARTDKELRDLFADGPHGVMDVLPLQANQALQRILWRMRAAKIGDRLLTYDTMVLESVLADDTIPVEPKLADPSGLDSVLDEAPTTEDPEPSIDGPTCTHCGGMTRPAGSCHICNNCGESSGCS